MWFCVKNDFKIIVQGFSLFLFFLKTCTNSLLKVLANIPTLSTNK